MTLQIPNHHLPKFNKFFLDLDKDLQNLGIQSYGISITTLEDVFLKVGHLQDPINADQEKVKEIELKRSKTFGSVANILTRQNSHSRLFPIYDLPRDSIE
jgi:ATP-binding cassette, subfamily A (ABC1), member 3